YGVRTNYQLALFRMVTGLPLQWHKDNHSGEIIENVNRASLALNAFLDGSFEVIHILSRFIGSVIILCFFMPSAGAVVLVMTLVIIGVTVLFDRVLFVQDQKLNDFYQKIAAGVHDYLTNITTVISLRLEDRAAGEVLRRVQSAWPTFRSNIRLNEWKWFATSMFVSLVVTGTLIAYLYKTFQRGSAFEAGTFFSLFEYLRRIGDGFFGFAWKYGQLVTHASKLKSAEKISDDYERLVSVGATATLPAGWGKIEIRDLDFAYADAQPDGAAFRGLGLTLERGQAIALVGESGSGKSTLLSLLRMLREPTRVTVVCDGVELPHRLLHVAHSTTLIPQDPEIFADTIRFNVTMGIEAAEEQILEMLERARFTSVLQRLPRGLQASIAEKGINLSGGEKQRLALARGFFFAQASEIVLLDESTSSVDAANERVIYTRLLAASRDRCIVAAIHKLHLLPLFDYIYVFAAGKVVEQGSYAELMERNGELARLVRNYAFESSEMETANVTNTGQDLDSAAVS
ncbi:MAG: ABC transporter ATP-binding protein, partial [Verrucomicrobia bacterium]|nr:ABC transporter ATP-binding protein [Verrucomicrobiota bacterium]